MVDKIYKNKIAIAIVVAGIIIAGAFIYINKGKIQQITTVKIPGELTSQGAGKKALDYINNNILKGKSEATLLESKEEDGLYKLKIKIEGQEYNLYTTKNGKLLFFQAVDLTKSTVQKEKTEKSKVEGTIGGFSKTDDAVCKENDKPIVYFFGLNRCPHCGWEHPVVEEVTDAFKDNISFHNNMDSSADHDIFTKYSTGGVPTIVIGCKYFRVGSGENIGKEEEKDVLSALICKLTDNKPVATCSKVQDLISKI